MATGEDYRYEGTTGGSPGVMTKFMHWYMDRVLRLATRDVAVRDVLLHVFSMILAPSALFRRRIVWGVLLEAIRPAAVAPLEATPRARRKVLYEVEPRYGRETS
jgi:hypothetical protein